ncbi:bifunctional helix-turn-helix transcriptional regulator/GNAT family N-acetyltransferase [Vibrio salinus]|uniref:bifunctional helix-turn-helix transcriptional regulator/GNAT family N-acetyltransferase n=1 Tax=Vibrio salinus TaxID=2899784 RepID=UPI001E308857|nr:bifunctional helix-turn-helix transcriptional regulator/GNAT family N-acetyltransferase [Vibrio salinus]MCE0494885.1 bifunctional helix-turn-helix transcriptional regulator/GNAT family N-acetyltransferase [Vibrio salinus]
MISSLSVESIRSSSRQLVRELGFMGGAFAGTNLSPSAVHTLLEIDKNHAVTARYLCGCLQLEKSSVSRMLKKLLQTGDIMEIPHSNDARSKQLILTPSGEKRVAEIHKYARNQIVQALKNLNKKDKETIIKGLKLYADALAGESCSEITRPEIKISTGDYNGMISKITELHSSYYSKTVGFGLSFESTVAGGLAEFSQRLSKPQNEIWLARQGDEIVGSVAIDGDDLGQNRAHLRWFIVSENSRGTGVGHRLLNEALNFVDNAGFRETHLNTIEGLGAAHHLYIANGFSCTDEQYGHQWGKQMKELRFVRLNPSTQTD